VPARSSHPTQERVFTEARQLTMRWVVVIIIVVVVLLGGLYYYLVTHSMD
jgi:hypothetical protein